MTTRSDDTSRTYSKTNAAVTGSSRMESIDLLRGLVMVLMAMDHVRIFFLGTTTVPIKVGEITTVEFFVRWLPHFCAPVFLFLAGTGAWLALGRGRTKVQLSKFLLTRGVWLIVLQFTLVHFSWFFSLTPYHTFTGILSIIGAAMIILAGLVFVPLWMIAFVGLAMIFGQPLFETLRLKPQLWPDNLWLLVYGGWETISHDGKYVIGVAFTILPWTGLMLLGYVFGPVTALVSKWRLKTTLLIGISTFACFIFIRFMGIGNVQDQQIFDDAWPTILEFINPIKYPGTLAFMFMTMGLALIVLSLWTRARDPLSRMFLIFGRTPLFFYLMHIPLIHLMAVVYSRFRIGETLWDYPATRPDDYWSFTAFWFAFAMIIVLMFPACIWFSRLKKRHQHPMLKYL